MEGRWAGIVSSGIKHGLLKLTSVGYRCVRDQAWPSQLTSVGTGVSIIHLMEERPRGRLQRDTHPLAYCIYTKAFKIHLIDSKLVYQHEWSTR